MSNSTDTESAQSSDEGNAPSVISFHPRGRSVNIVESDATGLDSLRDMVDNVIDATKRRVREGRSPPDTVQAKIILDPERDRLVIEDNAYGGIEPDRLGEIPAMGASSDLPDGIGHFGVGGIRPAVLGDKITYASHREGFPASEFTIDVSELRADDSGNQDVFESKRRDADIEVDWTRITIEEIGQGFISLIQAAVEEVGDIMGQSVQMDESTLHIGDPEVEALKLSLGRTYVNILEDGIRTKEGSIPFELQIQNLSTDDEPTPIESAERPDLLKLPVDGLSPRVYKNVPFAEEGDSDDSPPDVYANVRVGLQPEAKMETSGLYVTIQDRIVLYADKSNRLFSSQYLGSFRESAGHKRLVIEVELREADRGGGERTYLPINSMKNGFDYNSAITPHLLSFISNAADPYKSQGYEQMPDWMLKAFSLRFNENLDEDIVIRAIRDWISNRKREKFDEGTADIVIDKEGSKTNSARVKPKPGKWTSNKREYPLRDRYSKLVVVHKLLRIKVANPDEYLRQELAGGLLNLQISRIQSEALAIGYKFFMENEYDREGLPHPEHAPENPIEVNGGPKLNLDRLPRDIGEDEEDDMTPPIVKEIIDLARSHYDARGNGEYLEIIEAYQKPRYREELAVLTGGRIEELQRWNSEDDIPEDVPQSSNEELDGDWNEEMTAPSEVSDREDERNQDMQIPNEGLVIMIEGHPEPVSQETLEEWIELAEAQSLNELIEATLEALERKRELENAASVFQSQT